MIGYHPRNILFSAYRGLDSPNLKRRINFGDSYVPYPTESGIWGFSWRLEILGIRRDAACCTWIARNQGGYSSSMVGAIDVPK